MRCPTQRFVRKTLVEILLRLVVRILRLLLG